MTVLARLQEQAAQATRQAERLNKMVELAKQLGDDGLAELVAIVGSELPKNGNANGNAKADGPRGREAVRVIVRRRPGIWTLAQLREEMKREGWFTSDSGLEAAAKRLCDVNREGRRIGKGRYVFPANHGEEAAIESDHSGGAAIPLT
jgi:hypothetical protein